MTSRERTVPVEYSKITFAIVPSFKLEFKTFTSNQLLLVCKNFKERLCHKKFVSKKNTLVIPYLHNLQFAQFLPRELAVVTFGICVVWREMIHMQLKQPLQRVLYEGKRLLIFFLVCKQLASTVTNHLNNCQFQNNTAIHSLNTARQASPVYIKGNLPLYY